MMLPFTIKEIDCMKKVVLLGDSIRQIGYGQKVAEMLQRKCEVWQPEDNCRFAKYTLRMLFEYKEYLQGADVIHWNNGLWDACDIFGDGPFTPLDEYVSNMLRIADILLQYSKTVIFATITPTHPDYPYHEIERIKLYNDTLVPELHKKGVMINDLFTTMVEHRIDGICEDLIHLNEYGIALCATQVTKAIQKAIDE